MKPSPAWEKVCVGEMSNCHMPWSKACGQRLVPPENHFIISYAYYLVFFQTQYSPVFQTWQQAEMTLGLSKGQYKTPTEQHCPCCEMQRGR